MLTLIQGLPNSGKAALAQQLVKASPDNSVRLEPHMYFGVAPQNLDLKQMEEARSWCLAATESSLRDFTDTYVSDCFSPESLGQYIDLAKRLKVRVRILRLTLI